MSTTHSNLRGVKRALSRIAHRGKYSHPKLNGAGRFVPVPLSRFILPLVIVMLTGATVYGQDKTAAIDQLFSWATPSTPGCVCAVSQHGKVVVNRAYGSADLERDVPINPNTIFDAGSLVKQFVAAATLLLVEEGKISLSDDIRKYIPELPDYGHKITIDHLLTHTSGLRDWTGITLMEGKKSDALTMILRQRGLHFVPGEEWSYSNSGYVVMKEIIARVTRMPFGEFAHQRLFEPLGMKLTAYRHDLRDIVKNRALAYQPQGNSYKMAMLLDNERGGGGALLSTAGDLLIWNDALANARLGKFVTAKLQEPAKLNNGRTLGYARGLFLDSNRSSRVIWHSGSADGYKSMLARFPDQGLSIAIMCNSGDETDRMAFGRRIFDLFVPGNTRDSKAEARPPATTPDTASTADLSALTGLFFSEQTGAPLRLGVDRGRLRIAGGPALITVSNNRFKNPEGMLSFMSEDEFELRFLSKDQFELKTMEGKITRYRRARPYSPTSEELKTFAGRYESEEMRSAFEVTAVEGGLTMRLEYMQGKGFEFKAVDPDTFMRGNMIVRFVRDKNGKVVGLSYSNPVLRNISYTRLSNETRRG